MTLTLALAAIAALLALAAVAIMAGGTAWGRGLVYGGALLICAISGAAALVGGAATPAMTLPLGLPWLGAHFRMDALSAFFLVVVNLGAVAASLFALGHGRHEHAPMRVLPFYPVFLAGMSLMVVADDAYSFLFSWELMSLSSWALVVAHHASRENLRAGYIYIVMASFGTFALLLAFGLLAGPDGGYAFAQMRDAALPPTIAGLRTVTDGDRPHNDLC